MCALNLSSSEPCQRQVKTNHPFGYPLISSSPCSPRPRRQSTTRRFGSNELSKVLFVVIAQDDAKEVGPWTEMEQQSCLEPRDLEVVVELASGDPGQESGGLG